MAFLDRTLAEVLPTVDRILNPGDSSARVEDLYGSNDFISANKLHFYLGAIAVPSLFDKAVSSVFSTERGIYDEEHVLGLLSEIHDACTSKDPDVEMYVPPIKIIPQLAHHFNKKTGSAPNHPQIVDYVRGLAQRHFGQAFADQLVLINPADESHHVQFFEALEKTEDPMQVFEGEFDPEDVSSLSIARQLFLAAKKDLRLRKDLHETLPSRLRNKSVKNNPPVNGYALAELAIRLSDMLSSGMTMQGGMSRQYRYDQILNEIINGKAGTYRRISELQNLFQKNLALCFDSVYYEGPNVFENKLVKGRAKTRLAVQALGVGAVLGGIYGVGRYDEHRDWAEQAEAIETKMEVCAADVPFRGCDSDSWCRFDYVEPEYRTKAFERIVDGGIKATNERYGMDFSDPFFELQVRSLWVDHLCDIDPTSISTLGTLMERSPKLPQEIDLFVTQHQAYFAAQDLDASRPYVKLAGKIALFMQAAVSKEDLVIPCYDPRTESFSYLGEYTDPRGYAAPYEVYADGSDPENSHLLTRRANYKGCEFSTSEARSMAQAFITDQYRFDAHSLDSWYIDGVLNEPYQAVPHVVASDSGSLEKESIFFKSPYGVEYELKKYRHSDDTSLLSTEYAVARKQGETDFSTDTVKEASEIYHSLIRLEPTDPSKTPSSSQK